MPCKTGKIQVDETMIHIVAPFHKLVWEAPKAAVTKIVMQQGKFTVDIMIHATHGSYTAEMVTKQNAEKVFAGSAAVRLRF